MSEPTKDQPNPDIKNEELNEDELSDVAGGGFASQTQVSWNVGR
ncbi:MAG TPA: hypothetical protein VI248_25555 [Kineosporiaceae bacterium]